MLSCLYITPLTVIECYVTDQMVTTSQMALMKRLVKNLVGQILDMPP
jgi:hypothetical protein